jgi:hypothetical protein
MHASLLPAPLAGIFVTDILDAVPIDKYFELFKPSAGGEGGFIRLGLDFVKDPAELSRARGGTPWSSILQLQLWQMLVQSLHADQSSDSSKQGSHWRQAADPHTQEGFDPG